MTNFNYCWTVARHSTCESYRDFSVLSKDTLIRSQGEPGIEPLTLEFVDCSISGVTAPLNELPLYR